MNTVTDALKNELDIKRLSQYQVLHKQQWLSHLTTLTELCYEEHDQIRYARFKFTTYKGKGNAGKTVRSFAWPVGEGQHPGSLRSITDEMVQASSSVEPRHDGRRFFTRCIDSLFGSVLIEDIEELSSHSNFEKRHRLSATIYQEKGAVVVSLFHHVENGQHISVRLPIETIKAIAAAFSEQQ